MIPTPVQEQETTPGRISLERMKSRSREYRENREKSASRSSLSGSLKSLILSAADGKPCPTCNITMQHHRRRPRFESPNYVTIEHILPIKEGGANTLDNLIAMCLACNRARGYVYNQTRKVSRAEIDDVLEWLWLHVNEQRFTRVVVLQLAHLHPQHQAIFERSWTKQHARWFAQN